MLNEQTSNCDYAGEAKEQAASDTCDKSLEELGWVDWWADSAGADLLALREMKCAEKPKSHSSCQLLLTVHFPRTSTHVDAEGLSTQLGIELEDERFACS